MNKIHILYISAFSQWGGSTISLQRWIEMLDVDTFDITVVVPEEGPMIKKYKDAGANVEIVTMSILLRFNSLRQFLKYLINFLPSIIRLYTLIKKENIDIVHSNDSIILVGGMAAKLAGVRSITHIRDDIKCPQAVVCLRNLIINVFSDCIFHVSNAVKNNYTKFGGNILKSQVIYDGVNLEIPKSVTNIQDYKNMLSIPGSAKIITQIGRIDPNKGQVCLVYAANLIVKSIHSAYFLIVGDVNTLKFQWYKEKLIKMIGRLGLKGRVLLVGRQENVQNIINISDVVVLPSTYDALPGVICEASAYGKPVVASGVGGIPEIIIDGETGLLIPPGNYQILSDALIQLLSDEKGAQKMGLAGRKYMEDNFDLTQIVYRVEAIYRELVNINN